MIKNNSYTRIDFNNIVDPSLSKFGYISFRNVVKFNRDVLVRQDNYSEVIPEDHKDRLRKKGVFICVCVKGTNKRKLIPSCLARMILEGLVGDEELW
jgi:hypothetical protein